jgi:TPR repeat protein
MHIVCLARRVATAAAVLIAASTLLPSAAQAQDNGNEGQVALDAGLHQYQAGDYAAALQRLQLAAEYGETEAAEIVGGMYLVGERLYGPAVPVNLHQARRWLQVAAIKGRRTAQLTLGALDRAAGHGL